MKLIRQLPFFLFCAAMGLALIVIGMALGQARLPPYPQLRDAAKTSATLWASIFPPDYFGEVRNRSDQPVEGFSRWLTADDESGESYWVAGGLNQFLGACPSPGCLAVEMNRSGEILTTVPYRPAEIISATIPDALKPYEYLDFDPLRNTRPIGLELYPDGDLLVTFQAHGAVFPYGTGVARVAPDGSPRWFRFDYTHHWPTLLDDGTALVGSLRIGDVEAEVAERTGIEELTCDADAQTLDTIHHLGPDGELIEDIDLTRVVLESPYAQFLMDTSDPCDWLHLNRIAVLDNPAGTELATGDLVLSLRNINALAVLDGTDHHIKKLIRGAFLQQHAVQQLNRRELVLFDNWGGTSGTGASEIVAIDMLTGRERTLFPTPSTPEAYQSLYSSRAGYISVSPDGDRLIAVYSEAGMAFEISADDGELLAVYDHLHDVSDVHGIPDPALEFAVRYDLFSMLY